MKTSFFVTLEKIPRTSSQEKGVRMVRGRPMFYTKSKVKEVQDLYCWQLNIHRPPRPLEGAVRLKLHFYYPVTRGHKIGEPKATRPDVDNMAKLLIDCATACGYWKDDGQIADLRIIKNYSEPSGIGFEAVEIERGGLERG